MRGVARRAPAMPVKAPQARAHDPTTLEDTEMMAKTPTAVEFKEFLTLSGGAIRFAVLRSLNDPRAISEATRGEPYDYVALARQLLAIANPPCWICGVTVPTGRARVGLIMLPLRDDLGEYPNSICGVVCDTHAALSNEEIQEAGRKLWGAKTFRPETDIGKPGRA